MLNFSDGYMKIMKLNLKNMNNIKTFKEYLLEIQYEKFILKLRKEFQKSIKKIENYGQNMFRI